jgi:hypothetical protein
MLAERQRSPGVVAAAAAAAAAAAEMTEPLSCTGPVGKIAGDAAASMQRVAGNKRLAGSIAGVTGGNRARTWGSTGLASLHFDGDILWANGGGKGQWSRQNKVPNNGMVLHASSSKLATSMRPEKFGSSFVIRSSSGVFSLSSMG